LSDCSYEGDGGEEIDREAIVARGDAPPILKPSKHALDDVAPAVGLAVVCVDDVARDSCWDDGLYASVVTALRLSARPCRPRRFGCPLAV